MCPGGGWAGGVGWPEGGRARAGGGASPKPADAADGQKGPALRVALRNPPDGVAAPRRCAASPSAPLLAGGLLSATQCAPGYIHTLSPGIGASPVIPQPEPHQMAPPLRLGMVLECASALTAGAGVAELRPAGLEIEIH